MDPSFKYIFGEDGKESMISLLKTFLEIPDIEDITYLQTEDVGLGKADKRIHFDIACRASDGKRFIVEAQVVDQRFFNQRAMLYVSTMVRNAVREANEQAKKENKVWDYSFSPVYLLSLFKGTDGLNHSKPGCIHTYTMKDVKSGDDMSAGISITFVELGKYKGSPDERDVLNQWLYSLKNIENLEDMPDWITDGKIQKFYDLAEFANMPVSVREKIENYMTTELDWKNAMIWAVDKAKVEGKAEGREEGREEGANQKALEMARALKGQGVSIQIISECSGLPLETISKL